MEEQFVKCLFSDSHWIGNNGTVKRTNRNAITRYGTDIVKGLIKPDGYKMYYLNYKWYYSHRLVAIHFIDNPNNLKEINHIDGDKLNNYYTNLEWSTRKLNIKHRFEVLGQTNTGRTKGFTVSDEVKAKMSAAKKGRKREYRGKWL